MIVKIIRIGLLVGVIAAGTAELLALRHTHARLQQEAAQLRTRNAELAAQHERIQQLQGVLARAQSGDMEARRTVHLELIQARAEAARLEITAKEQRAKRQTDEAALADALTRNRDPAKGLVRLENYQNMGQSTPSAAFQTLVWAMMKGDDETAARTLVLTPGARQKAEALIASLPASMQAKYPTPEKIAALMFAQVALSQSAMQVVGETGGDPLNARVDVNGLEGGPENLAFQLGANGWQAVVPEGAIKKFQNELNNTGGSVNKW